MSDSAEQNSALATIPVEELLGFHSFSRLK